MSDNTTATTPEISSAQLPALLGTNGVYGVGKDFVLKRHGYLILGFADPLYLIAKTWLGTDDKTQPGVREFLQAVGQWGRGVKSPEYPLNIERAYFVNRLWSSEASADKQLRDKLVEQSVDRKLWGTPDIWTHSLKMRIKAALVRLGRAGRVPRVAVSNVRFLNEVELVRSLGGQVWFVDADPVDIKARRKAGSDKSQSDTSEKLALAIRRGLKDPAAEVAIEGASIKVDFISGVLWNSATEPESKQFGTTPVYRA